MKRIRAGFVGVGWMGRALLQRLCQRDDVRVAGIFEPNRQHALSAVKDLGISPDLLVSDFAQLIGNDNIDAIWLVSPNGFHGPQAIEALTVESTAGKLISNDIKSIGVDPLTGTVYFGTASGLASLTTSAVAPKQSFEKLVIYPNPYLVPNAIPLSVDGLVENSSIRILSIDGTLVRDLQTPGGRIGFWDGKDEAGNDVSSGIYIVVGYSEDGTQIANGKVAVLRR